MQIRRRIVWPQVADTNLDMNLRALLCVQLAINSACHDRCHSAFQNAGLIGHFVPQITPSSCVALVHREKALFGIVNIRALTSISGSVGGVGSHCDGDVCLPRALGDMTATPPSL